MAASGALRNRASVHRRAETRDARGDVLPGWTVVGTAWIGVRDWSPALADEGPGEHPAGTAEAVAHERADIEPRDVLKVTVGPPAGTNWTVVGAWPEPRGRERALSLERFEGTL